MVTQQEVLDVLSAVAADVDTVAGEFVTLEQQLTDLQNSTPPEVDLSDVLASAQSIRSKLEAIGQTAAAPAGDDTGTAATGDDTATGAQGDDTQGQ